MKLLIVDDERYICTSLKNGFDWNSIGFDEVFDASRVSEALNIIDNNLIDIIITDIKMPKLSGIDLIKEISSRSPNTKIIVISGYDKFEYAQIALKYGVTDYFLKPARIEEIAEAVKKAIGTISQNIPKRYKNVLIKDFLCNLIFRHVTEEEAIRMTIEEYELDILKTEFLIVVFADNGKETLSYEPVDVINSISEYAENKFNSILFDDNHGHIVMIMENQYSKEKILELCNGCCNAVIQHLKLTGFERIIGKNSDDIMKIPNLYYETVQIADKFVLSGKERAVFVSDIENVKIYNIVYMAKKYVCDHINENITIQMISDMIHITPGYFSSMFRKTTGESFVKYVNMQKIEKAKNLLETEDKLISEIAEDIGFDVKYFNRVFKKYTDLTPSEYRVVITERR